MKRIIFFLILFFLILALGTWFSSDRKLSLIQGGRFDMKDMKFVSKVEIALINGEYIWVSNDNEPLNKVVWSGADNGKSAKITYFINPEGKGYIAIKHEDADTFGSPLWDDRLPNLTEYKMNPDGTFIKSEYFTSVWPFPGIKGAVFGLHR